MRILRILPVLVLVIGAGEGDDGQDQGRLPRPSLVALDFRERPVMEVVQAIRDRSGNTLEIPNVSGLPGEEPRVTLEALEPVPFWEALDRLCEEAHFQRTLVVGGALGIPRPQIQLFGPYNARVGQPGLARYVGPLRLGSFSLHARRDIVYVPGSVNPIPNQYGPFYAEFQVQVEPRFVAHRAGPLARLEAEDEKGQSLIDPKLAERDPPPNSLQYSLDWIHIPLARPSEPGTTLKRLRGVIPIEIGVRSAEPTLVIPLPEAAGKTFHAPDATLIVQESSVNRQGSAHIRLVVRLEGERNDPAKVSSGLLYARAMGLFHHQLEIVDDEGKPMTQGSGGSSVQRNELSLRYTVSHPPSPPDPKTLPPTKLRYYALDWTIWDAPFEFGEIPLP
jgi:hypothetical protein